MSDMFREIRFCRGLILSTKRLSTLMALLLCADLPLSLGKSSALLNLWQTTAAVAQSSPLIPEKTVAAQHQAIDALRQSLNKWKAAQDQPQIAQALQKLGDAYDQVSAHHLAIEQYQQALAIYRKVENKDQEAILLRALGDVYASMAQQNQQAIIDYRGQWPSYFNDQIQQNQQVRQQARTFYQQARDRFQQLQQPQQQAQVLIRLAQLYRLDDGSEGQEAQPFLQAALDLLETEDAPREAAMAWRLLGQTYASWKRKKETWQSFDQSLKLARENRDRNLEAHILFTLAGVYERHFDQPDQALATYQQALQGADTTGDKRLAIDILQARALLTFHGGNTSQGIADAQHALTLAQAIGHWPTILHTMAALHRLQSLRQGQPRQGDQALLLALHQASRFYEQLGDTTTAADVHRRWIAQLIQASIEYYNRDQPSSAEAMTAQARQYFQSIGDLQGEVDVLVTISEQLSTGLADHQVALRLLHQAQRVAQQQPQLEAQLLARQIAPHWRYRLQDPQQALTAYWRAIELYQQAQDWGAAAYHLAYPMASLYEMLGDAAGVETVYQKARVAYRQAGHPQRESDFLIKLGEHYHQTGQQRLALAAFNQAQQLFEGNAAQQATTLRIIGQSLTQLQEREQAIVFYRQAVTQFAASGNRNEQAQMLLNIGGLALDLNQPQVAQAAYQQARDLHRQAKDGPAEAGVLARIGRGYGQRRQVQTGLAFYQQALDRYEQQNDQRLVVQMLLQMGQLHAYAGNQGQGLQFCDRALQTLPPTQYRSHAVGTLVRIGKLCYTLGGKAQAEQAFQAYRTYYQRFKDPYQEATALLRIGQYYAEVGGLDQVLIAFNQARQVYQALGDQRAEADLLTQMGSQYQRLGNPQQAIAFYEQAQQTAHRINARRIQVQASLKIGQLYRQLKDYPQALSVLRQAQPWADALRDRKPALHLRSAIATTHHQAGQLAPALADYQQAIRFARTLGGEQDTIIGHLLQIGDIHQQQGNAKTALTVLQEALGMTQRLKGSRRTAVLLALGNTHLALKQPQPALALFQQALDLTNHKAPALLGLAKTHRALGQLEQALGHIKAALPLVEARRTQQQTPAERQQFFASQQDYYEFYTDLLMELHQQDPTQGYDQDAFHINERSRARSLLDLLSEANTDIRKGVDPTLVTQERHLQQQLDAVEAQRTAIYSNASASLAAKAEVDQTRQYLLQQYQAIQAQIRTKSPSYAALSQPQPLTVQQVQAQILEDDTLLLQYALGDSHSYLWAITRTRVYSYRLPPRATLEDQAKQLYQQWQNPNTRYLRGRVSIIRRSSNKTGRALSQLLLQPVAHLLKGQRLVVVSDGALQYLPFAALPQPQTQQQPLLQQHEVVHVPSASALAILRREMRDRKPAPKTIAMLADPVFSATDRRSEEKRDRNWSEYLLNRSAQTIDVGVWRRLPGTRREAQAILALVPTADQTAAFDFEANRTVLQATSLNQYRIVHFATHGLLNSAQPELSGIVLSMVNRQGQAINGFLRLHDVFNLDLAADLVVLSACQTGLGKQVRGEGLVGLTRGFMYAGTPRVVVSLWNVDDEATAALMSRFYRAMLNDGQSATAALRTAQLELQTQTRWQSPYYWAAFTLQGEWQ